MKNRVSSSAPYGNSFSPRKNLKLIAGRFVEQNITQNSYQPPLFRPKDPSVPVFFRMNCDSVPNKKQHCSGRTDSYNLPAQETIIHFTDDANCTLANKVCVQMHQQVARITESSKAHQISQTDGRNALRRILAKINNRLFVLDTMVTGVFRLDKLLSVCKQCGLEVNPIDLTAFCCNFRTPGVHNGVDYQELLLRLTMLFEASCTKNPEESYKLFCCENSHDQVDISYADKVETSLTSPLNDEIRKEECVVKETPRKEFLSTRRREEVSERPKEEFANLVISVDNSNNWYSRFLRFSDCLYQLDKSESGSMVTDELLAAVDHLNERLSLQLDPQQIGKAFASSITPDNSRRTHVPTFLNNLAMSDGEERLP